MAEFLRNLVLVLKDIGFFACRRATSATSVSRDLVSSSDEDPASPVEDQSLTYEVGDDAVHNRLWDVTLQQIKGLPKEVADVVLSGDHPVEPLPVSAQAESVPTVVEPTPETSREVVPPQNDDHQLLFTSPPTPRSASPNTKPAELQLAGPLPTAEAVAPLDTLPYSEDGSAPVDEPQDTSSESDDTQPNETPSQADADYEETRVEVLV